MTAVLSPTDPLRRDRVMSSHDDNQINYSSNNGQDWKEKYYEAADMLQETRAELDDFQRSSKELEEELERELDRTEKTMQDLRVKATRAETERDDWKAKFMSLQTTHNTTTTSLQRELDQLRQSYQQIKIHMRELEMGNDDLERNERAVSSSLADAESKYARALEEKILLEHELLDKANMEEEFQRLKDEIRDANLEITVLKDQLAQARVYAKAQTRSSTIDSSSTSAGSSFKPQFPSSAENILSESPPSEFQTSNLIQDAPSTRQFSRSSSESSTQFNTAKNISTSSSMESTAGHSARLKRAGFPPTWNNNPTTPSDRTGTMSRSHSIPTWSPSRLPTSTPRPVVTPRAPADTLANASTSNIASKSRGVQMVSEMRARVRNLEQRLHTRVPRLRMGSVSGRKAEITAATSVASVRDISTAASTPENPRAHLKRRSADLESERKRGCPSPTKAGDTSGWVLIMEDSMSPSPTKDREKERHRFSNPTSSPFSLHTVHKSSSTKTSSTSLTDANLGRTGSRRSQSRLSGDGRDSTSTVSTTSTLPTPTSRPTSPTFLPIPSPGLYNTALPTLKRSTGPTQKRSSLGASGLPAPTSFLQPPNSYRDKHASSTTNKSLPPPPNFMTRSSRPPSALGQSRIGRPAAGRRSVGPDDVNTGRGNGRSRSGSTGA
ncbi:hypothetical protein DFH11DRAFT_1873584 [Phellopilus nigrolimitatus]|nr:hypothetical protein DFH11DRAFT_1873584 [Phellopilus nigrolimitatus]